MVREFGHQNPFLGLKDRLTRRKEHHAPKTPEQILSSHGVIDVTDWLRQTAFHSPLQAAYLRFNTADGDVHILGQFNEAHPDLRLVRLSRRPNPVYGPIIGEKTLKLVVVEHTPRGKKTVRNAYITQVSNELVTSGHDFPSSRRRSLRKTLHVPGIATLTERLASTKSERKQKKLLAQIDTLLKTKGLNPHVHDDLDTSPRDIMFTESGYTIEGTMLFDASRQFSRINNPQDEKNLSITPINPYIRKRPPRSPAPVWL